jgi:hypothetical protein
MRVFLAHASAQQRECDRIVIKLRARRFKVFYSPDAIDASEHFDQRIRSEIARCGAMIFLVSPQSITEGCYALTELQMASERWPNPQRRILAVVTEEVPLARVPSYLRDNIELLKPSGDLATETADAMVAIRKKRLSTNVLKASVLAVCIALATGALVWRTRLSAQGRLNQVTNGLLDSAMHAPVYLDTCVTKLESFSRRTHKFKIPDGECDTRSILTSLPLPALVVAQTGYGKKGFLQTFRGIIAKNGRPSVLVSYRDCMRGRPRAAEIDLPQCLAEKVREETHAAGGDVIAWLRDPSRYILIFDAIDDSASRERVFQLVHLLWKQYKAGGAVVMSAQPETLNYVLARYGLEEWVVWLRDKIPTFDVRGVNINSVQRIATDYEEHRVALQELRTVLDFPQKCPEARAVIQEWVSQPKLFRERGVKTVTQVADAMRALRPGECNQWRRNVLTAMLRARFWSYCHDELCNYKTDGDRYIKAAQRLRTENTIGETELAAIAKEQGFRDIDELAFPLLSTGVLYFEAENMKVDPEWIPE